MSDGEVHIVLLHGTVLFSRFRPLRKWSRRLRSDWTNAGSTFRGLFRELFNEPVVFHSIPWSGGNSDLHRWRAAEKFSKVLRRLAERHPNAEFYAITHSHGGNVISRAMRDVSTQNILKGIVCLGTPFFIYKPQNLDAPIRIARWSLFLWLFWLFGLLLGLAAMFLKRSYPAVEGGIDSGSIPWWVLVLCIVIPTLIILVIVWSIPLLRKSSSELLINAERTANSEAAKLDDGLLTVPLINIESRVKEARIIILIGRAAHSSLFACCSIAALLIPVLNIIDRLIPSSASPELINGLVTFQLWTSGILVALVCLGTFFLAIYRAVFIGQQGWRTLVYVDTEIDFVPDSRFKMLEFTVPQRSWLDLQHCALYRHEPVVRAACDWIATLRKKRVLQHQSDQG